MRKIEDLEPVFRDGIEQAIDRGCLLISGEYGVAWDGVEWVHDGLLYTTPMCCVVGAFLTTFQPRLDPVRHAGDLFEAARQAFGVGAFSLVSFLNGFDACVLEGEERDEDAVEFGKMLREQYRPMSFEYLVMTGSAGVTIPKDYRRYVQAWCVPGATGEVDGPVDLVEPEHFVPQESGTFLSAEPVSEQLISAAI